MEMRASEAGLTIDKDLILVVAFNEQLVRKHGAKLITLKFLLDSQTLSSVDGHYEAEYELKGDRPLKLRYKRIGREMVIKVEASRSQVSYTINIDRCVDDDLVRTPTREIDDLLVRWMSD